MATSSHYPHHADQQHVAIPLTRPFYWIALGWDDFRHHQSTSLAYGFIVVGMGLLLIALARHPYFLAAAISGFLLVGPLMTTGLCELSRRRERGEEADFDTSLTALTRNQGPLMRFALILLGFSVVWFLASTFMLHEILGSAAPSYSETRWGDLLDQMTPGQMMAYTVVGGALAAVVFALSVVTIPMLIDRDASAGEAMSTSARLTLSHLPSMILWAVLIATLVGIGFVPAMLGLVIVFPLLGHATWHAYRDLVK